MSKAIKAIVEMAEGQYMSEGLSEIVETFEAAAARRREEPRMVEGMTVEDLIREWERIGREVDELNTLRERRRQEREQVKAQARDAMKASGRPGGWIVDGRIYFATPEGLLDIRSIANLPGGSR